MSGRMARPGLTVGLETDEAWLRGVILRRAAGTVTVIHAAEWPLPKEPPEREAAVAAALATVKARTGTKPPAAWFDALQGPAVALRLLQIPPVPRAEMRGAVMWEARTHVGFPLDRAFCDHVPLGEVEREGGGRQILVAFAAAAEEAVLARVEPLQAAGIRLSGLGPTAAVLWSARRFLADAPGAEPFALVHAGELAATVCVGKGERLVFTREIALAGGPLVASGPGQEEQPTLVRELRRTLHHYQERHGGERIGTVILSGATACVPGVADVLGRLLGCTVQIADPLRRLGGPAADAVPGRAPALALAAAAATGECGINLLPPHLRPRARRRLGRVLVPLAAAAALVAGYHQWSLVSAEPALRVAAERAEAELTRRRSAAEELAQLKRRQAHLERVAQHLPTAIAEAIGWPDLFRRVAQGLPGSVALRRLAFSTDEDADRAGPRSPMRASLEGVAFGSESETLVALATAIESLQGTGWFKGVRVSAPIRRSKDYTAPAAEFGLTFDVVVGPAPAPAVVAREGAGR